MSSPFDRVAEHLIRLHGETVGYQPPAPPLLKRFVGAKAPAAETWRVANPPAESGQLAQFEASHSVSLPPDVVACYQTMNGSPEYTAVGAGWMRFWPLEEWRPASEEFPTDPKSVEEPLSSSFCCADSGIMAFIYAIDLSPARLGRVYSTEPTGGRQVASTFSDFVSKVLSASGDLF